MIEVYLLTASMPNGIWKVDGIAPISLSQGYSEVKSKEDAQQMRTAAK